MARVLTFLALILAFGSSLDACQRRSTRPPCPANERCLEYGNGSDPVSLDPQRITATNEAEIVANLIEGLFTDGPDGNPAPGVALSSETSTDGLVWTFHLRPEVWSDGAAVTASDFVFAYRRILDPKTGSSYAYLDYLLKNGEAVNEGRLPPEAVGAKALDDHTLQLTLEHPAPYLPQVLKHQAFFPVPEHAVRQWGDAWVEPGKYIGNGAYRLIAWKLGDYIRLQKNPLFHDAAHVCFDRVNYYPTNDPVSAERRVLSHELDLNAAIQSNRVAFLRASPRSAPYVHSHPFLITSYLIFNQHQKDVPALKDLRVRQALSMAVDRRFITDKLLRAGQVPTTAFVPAIIAGYLPVGAPHPHAAWADWPLAKRQAEARRLVSQAGYSPEHPLKLQLKIINSPANITLAQSLQADWKSVGIDVSLRQEDGIVAYQSFEARDFQIGIAGWVADYDDPKTFLDLMKSDTGAQNYGDYHNPAYDALLDKADHEPNAQFRAGYLARAEQMMLDDADVAPILVSVGLNLVDPRLTGFVDNATDIHRARYLCPRR
jgi:oligopeptide transport system substrate-binding protein